MTTLKSRNLFFVGCLLLPIPGAGETISGGGQEKKMYDRLIQAEREPDPVIAVKKYRAILKMHGDAQCNDAAVLGICRIYYLLSQWNVLAIESRAGLASRARGEAAGEIRYFLSVALLNLGRYDEAKKECLILCETNHGYKTLARALLLLSRINQKISGNSSEYLENLNDLILGMHETEEIQCAIYLLGSFHESKNDYDRAYSAYADVIKYFPDSPEAILSIKRIESLKHHNPVRKKYFPGPGSVAKSEKIDITPETAADDRDAAEYYSVSVGPCASYDKIQKIKKMLGDYGVVRSVRTRIGYSLLVGRNTTSDEAMKTRIRLAEEHGINGKIVKISTDSGKKYIYGE